MKLRPVLVHASALLISVLSSGVCLAGGPSLRECKADVLAHGYINESGWRADQAAERLCTNNTPEQLARARELVDKHYVSTIYDAVRSISRYPAQQIECAKKEFDAKPAADRTFAVSSKCQDLVVTVAAGAPRKANNLLAVVTAAGDCSMYLKAMAAAKLTATIATGGPFTLFVPTDAAFGKPPEGAYDHILQMPDRLKQIMTFHMAAGLFPSGPMQEKVNVKTAEGRDVRVTKMRGVLHVGSGKVVRSDVPASKWPHLLHRRARGPLRPG